MIGRADPVRRFFEAMERRDWPAAGALLASDAEIWWPATDERFVGAAFVEMNRAYPEGWSIEVVETVGDGERVAARVRVTHGHDVVWCAGTYTVHDGVIAMGVEYWVTEGAEEPPEWRAEYSS